MSPNGKGPHASKTGEQAGVTRTVDQTSTPLAAMTQPGAKTG